VESPEFKLQYSQKKERKEKRYSTPMQELRVNNRKLLTGERCIYRNYPACV
jgi:hypothetical protein